MIDNSATFKAIVVRETPDGFSRSVEEKKIDSLPDDDVLIRVHYSSLNYKDALSASGHRGVTSQYPHTPGIDASGIVVRSSDKRFIKGDKVIVTSYDLGMNTPGGFGQYISVPADWIVPLPEGLSLKESMILGTAGFTAAYAILKIRNGNIEPDRLPVVVTGATGGVGSMAVAILSQLGYRVVAVSGKEDQQPYLRKLGASEVAGRDMVTDRSNKQLLDSKWSAAVETTGGEILDTVIRQTAHNGVVACCGNVLGHMLKTSIYPFILRGVSLMGVDSGICLMPKRIEIWNKVSAEWKLETFDQMYREVTLEELSEEIDLILEGGQTGRVIINLLD